jgi:carboxymethylenebutenolidase
MAGRVVATTPRRHEWVDVRAGNSRIRTWVVYPAGTERVGAVLVLTGAPGIRDNDWELAVADQLAQEGFIALVPDFATGLGPGGGNYDSFQFIDERMQALQKRNEGERLALLKAVREYAAKLPRSNGRTGSIGFCGGGTTSFRLATEVPEHNASVVYYGSAPPAASLAKTTAPVLGFYGGDDFRVTATVEPTRAEMKRLGKSYEAHVYPHVTHSFLWMQDLGNNFQATVDSWHRAIAFYRQHLETPAPRTR